MRIVFMGTPEFAIASLKKLIESNHEVVAVVSTPDKERGRGKKVTSTPIKEFALQNGLEVLTPVSLKEEKFVLRLKEIDADLFIVVAFRILPREVYALSCKGSINLHGSLLPKYRGAAPIQWALINGEKETGVTAFFLEDKVDTGNIILQEKIKIDDEDDFGSLHDKMMVLGADILLKTIEKLSIPNPPFAIQNESLASPAPKITKEICEINWNKSAVEIHNLVRGLSPYPCAFFKYSDKIIKVFKTKLLVSSQWSAVSGQLATDKGQPAIGQIKQTKTEIFIATGSGIIQILELQPEGRKRMTAEEFLRGYTFENHPLF